MLSWALAPLLLAGLQATTVSAIPSISAVGSKFFYENGTQFYIKGGLISPDLPSTWLTPDRYCLSAHTGRPTG